MSSEPQSTWAQMRGEYAAIAQWQAMQAMASLVGYDLVQVPEDMYALRRPCSGEYAYRTCTLPAVRDFLHGVMEERARAKVGA